MNTFSLQDQHSFQQVHQIVCQLGAFHHHLILLPQQFFVPLIIYLIIFLNIILTHFFINIANLDTTLFIEHDDVIIHFTIDGHIEFILCGVFDERFENEVGKAAIGLTNLRQINE